MAISTGTIEVIAKRQTNNLQKDFADRVAKKLHVKAAGRKARLQFEAAKALTDMAEVFQSEGWNL